jgi:hypothetical protein
MPNSQTSLYRYQQAFAEFLQAPVVSSKKLSGLLPWLGQAADTTQDDNESSHKRKKEHSNGNVPLSQRLAVYRNNVHYSLSQALAAQFPVIQRLVGPDFFSHLAQAFVAAHFPTEPALTFYGTDFPEFLEQRSDCQSILYLADVARLELACQQAMHAADVQPLSTTDLMTLPPAQVADSKLLLHPSAVLLQSAWPVQQIYEENQKPEPGELRLEQAQLHALLIYRRGFNVQIVTLQASAFTLLRKLQLSNTIMAAWETTQRDFSLDDAELIPMLVYLLNLEVFSSINSHTD